MTTPRGIGKGNGSRKNSTTLKIAKLDKIIDRSKELHGTTIKAGFDKSSGRHPYNNIPYTTIALWLEEGTSNNVQPRPFMKWTFQSEIHHSEIRQQLIVIVKKVFAGGNIKGDLNNLGKKMRDAIKETMVFMSRAFPNRKSWADQKGHDNAFFWTGEMYDSVMFSVQTKAISAKQRRS